MESTDSWFHETPQSAEMLMRETLDVLDQEAIVSRWYARADTDGGYCIMDADQSPSEQWPPILDGMTERLARHVVLAHNTWLTAEGIKAGPGNRLPETVRCPSCRREYTTTKTGRIRVHYWDGYIGGKRCVCSGMTMSEAREFATLKLNEALDAAEEMDEQQRVLPRSLGMGHDGPADLSEREGFE